MRRICCLISPSPKRLLSRRHGICRKKASRYQARPRCRGSALNSEFASESFSSATEEREGSEQTADLSAEGPDGPDENLNETIDEFIEEQQKDTGEEAQEETLNGAAVRAWEVLQDTGIEESSDELACGTYQ